MSNPKLAYNNFFTTGTVTASSEYKTYVKENAYDWLTYDFWLGLDDNTNYLTVDMGSSKSADYWAIFSHNLQSKSGSVKLQYSTDNFSSSIVDVGTAVTPTDDKIIFREFSSISARYWRFEFSTTGGAALIGVAMLGSSLELEYTLPVDAGNFIHYARDNVYINNQSNTGTFLGRSLIRKGLNGKVNFRFVTPSWFRSNWEAFMDHAEQKPFLFVADPTTYPDEVIYSYLDGKQTDPRPTDAKYMNFSINVKALKDSGIVETVTLAPWDIRTLEYTSKNFYISEDTLPTGLSFKTDGTNMYVVGGQFDSIYQYTLGTAWDVSTASYSGSPEKKFSVTTESTNPQGLSFKTDGTEMYMVGNGHVYQYTLSTPWEVNTASYSGSPEKKFDFSSEDNSPVDVIFKDDGLKMYMIGTTTPEKVYQYTLGTAWQVNTASYDSKVLDLTSESGGPQDVFFRDDGTMLYVVESINQSIYQYILSVAWDISTATYDNKSFYLGLQSTSPVGVSFRDDGFQMYFIGIGGRSVYQYYVG